MGPISVNVSRVNMYNQNLVNLLTDLVAKYEIPPRLLQLEVTESAYMVGGTPEDFVGKDVGQLSDWFCPDDVPQWNAAVAQLCADAKATDGIYRFKNRAAGEYLWLRIKGCKARVANDEEFLYFTFTDESELKNAENRESALRELYASSIDAAELVVWEYDIAAHTVTFDKSGYTSRRCGELGLPTVFPNVPECLYSLIPEEYHETTTNP